MFRSTRLSVAGLFALALWIGAPAQAQTVLKYKFKEGEKLAYVMDQKMNMQMDVAGQDISIAISQVMDMDWETGAVDKDGKALIKQKLGRIQFTMEGGAIGKVTYDSKDGKLPCGPVGDIMGPLFKALEGAEFSMKMSPTGEISDVAVPEKLAKAMKNLPAGAGADLFSEDALKKMMTQSGLVLPAKGAEQGKAWEQTTEMNGPPRSSMKMVDALEHARATGTAETSLEKGPMKPDLSKGVM